jgi:putative PIN family toxin of toxin-antitoxin system
VRRVVLDVNVYVSALLVPTGSPAPDPRKLVRRPGRRNREPLLLAELERVLKFRRSIPVVQVDALLSALAEDGIAFADPQAQPGARPDPGDDYLVALARAADADCIVSGDMHLTALNDPRPPVMTPREFLTSLS